MSLQEILIPSITKAVQELFGVSIDKIEFQATRKDFEGDITMVIFPLLKIIKGNPAEIGSKIGTYLVENVSEVEKFNKKFGKKNSNTEAISGPSIKESWYPKIDKKTIPSI